MTEVLSPFVYWAQTDKNVTLKVDLKDAEEPWVELNSTSLAFSAVGKGARGLHNYQFKLKFQDEINVNESEYKTMDSQISFTLRKAKVGYWPKLISLPSKPAWLKIDFDRWTSENASADDEEPVRDVREDYPSTYDNLQKEERGYRTEDWKKVYLVVYNLCQFVGFLYILAVLSLRYASEGPKSMASAYDNVGSVFKLLQLFQWLEVMHPIFGYTRNAVLPPLLQVSGRCVVLFALIDAEPRMQTKPVIFYLFVIWTSIEVVRYPFYIMQLNKLNIYFLTWLRYTLWVPLYPLGFFCEGTIYLRSIPYLEETKRFCIPLPNAWNFSFDMPTAVRVFLLIFSIPCMFLLMSHMYRDRKRKLGRGKSKMF